MASVRLTDFAIKAIPVPIRGQTEVFDSQVVGLSIRVSQRGTRAFSLKYRVPGGRERRLSLGRYPLVRLADARSAAADALRVVVAGGDPAVERGRERAAYATELFPSVLDTFIENHAKRRTKSWRETDRFLRREFVPSWRHHRVREIVRRDVSKILDAIVGRNSPSAAIHAFAAVRKFFNWCVEKGYVEASPCTGMRAPDRIESRDRVLLNDELVSIWRAADRVGYPFGTLTQLLILTGQRRSEVAGMLWAELDFTKRQWTLDGTRNK